MTPRCSYEIRFAEQRLPADSLLFLHICRTNSRGQNRQRRRVSGSCMAEYRMLFAAEAAVSTASPSVRATRGSGGDHDDSN